MLLAPTRPKARARSLPTMIIIIAPVKAMMTLVWTIWNSFRRRLPRKEIAAPSRAASSRRARMAPKSVGEAGRIWASEPRACWKSGVAWVIKVYPLVASLFPARGTEVIILV